MTSRPTEQIDVEHVGAVRLLVHAEQVEEEGREAVLVESGGDLAVALAQPAGAAAVGEDDQAPGVRGDGEVAGKANRRRRDLDGALIHLASASLSGFEPRLRQG